MDFYNKIGQFPVFEVAQEAEVVTVGSGIN